MKFHQTQSIVARDKTKYRIVNCGRQWGKTTLSVWEMLACAYAQKDRRVGYFAPYVSQARDIAWDMLKKATEPVWSKPPNETRLELYIKTKDGGISEILLKGFENIESARGQQFDLLVLDEVAKMKRFEEGWQAILLPTLLFRNGKALFISTPYGYNHFHKLYLEGQSGNPNYKSYTFTSYQNPFLSRDLLDDARKTTTPDFFSQEYMAEFTRMTGLIYKEFDITKHVHEFEFQYDQYGDFLFGQDFAVRGYTAAVPGTIKSDGHIYILDNYKEENRTALDHGEDIKQKLKLYADFGRYTGYGDPAGWIKNQRKGDMLWSVADEYLEMGFPLVPGNNEVSGGINYVRQAFKSGKLHIHPRCQKLIDELLQYQWKDQPERSVGMVDAPEHPRKLNDHLVDSLRYMLYSKPVAPEEEERPRLTVFPGSFPPPRIEKPSEDNDQITPIDFPDIYD